MKKMRASIFVVFLLVCMRSVCVDSTKKAFFDFERFNSSLDKCTSWYDVSSLMWDESALREIACNRNYILFDILIKKCSLYEDGLLRLLTFENRVGRNILYSAGSQKAPLLFYQAIMAWPQSSLNYIWEMRCQGKLLFELVLGLACKGYVIKNLMALLFVRIMGCEDLLQKKKYLDGLKNCLGMLSISNSPFKLAFEDAKKAFETLESEEYENIVYSLKNRFESKLYKNDYSKNYIFHNYPPKRCLNKNLLKKKGKRSYKQYCLQQSPLSFVDNTYKKREKKRRIMYFIPVVKQPVQLSCSSSPAKNGPSFIEQQPHVKLPSVSQLLAGIQSE